MSQPWFVHPIRVRYQETDQMGVVYHANYLIWCEVGRAELMRALGMNYRQLETRGILLPVTEANLIYKLPARYDDNILIHTKITEASPVRLAFQYEIRRVSEGEKQPIENLFVDHPKGELLVSGNTWHVWVNRSEWKIVRLDKEVPELYRLLEQYMSNGR